MTALDTPRLRLQALSLEQLCLILDDSPTLETELGIPVARELLTARVLRAIRMKIKKMRKADPADHNWYTYWLIIIKMEGSGAGLAGFKGIPDTAGRCEIGYGIDPAHQGQGYMSEAVRSLVGWALRHPACSAVTATAVSNPASRRLLEKLGAHLVTEDDNSSSWEFIR